MIKSSAIFSKGDTEEYRTNGIDWNFHNEYTQQHLHALHPYPARFIPQIPRLAILKWSQPGDIVLDPFCGCGTTLLESILLERHAIGVDNNAVACLVSKAKTSCYSTFDLDLLRKFVHNLTNLTIRTKNESEFFYSSDLSSKTCVPKYESISYWFDNKSIFDLGQLKSEINNLPELPRLLAKAVFSSIIVWTSYQDSDTRYSRQLKTYTEGSAIKRFQAKLRNTINRVNEIIDMPKANCEVCLGDSRCLNSISDESINLIITSPPYLNAYDYHKYHRHRLHWIDGDVNFARDFEIGKHDTFSRPNAKPDRYFEDMEKCFLEWYRVMRPRSYALVLIGDAIVNGKPVAVGDQFIKICENIGLHCENHWIRKLEKCKKSFNQDARINEEHVLLFHRE